jgi:hypothetical protein
VERRHRSPALRGERPSGSATSRSFFRDDRTDNGLTGGHGMVNCSPSWGVLKIRLAQWALVEVVILARGGEQWQAAICGGAVRRAGSG